ncbi:hypothetical protein MT997_22235 [Paenibacillus sp. OVF10]|nr:hypothetical protein MT997_22235 [Paenibacillus sp. OVF10]
MTMISKKWKPLMIALLLAFSSLPLQVSALPAAATAAVKTGISNASLSAKVGDLGQIEELYINNNPTNKQGSQSISSCLILHRRRMVLSTNGWGNDLLLPYGCQWTIP